MIVSGYLIMACYYMGSVMMASQPYRRKDNGKNDIDVTCISLIILFEYYKKIFVKFRCY
jgi:hypothetical protein